MQSIHSNILHSLQFLSLNGSRAVWQHLYVHFCKPHIKCSQSVVTFCIQLNVIFQILMLTAPWSIPLGLPMIPKRLLNTNPKPGERRLWWCYVWSWLEVWAATLVWNTWDSSKRKKKLLLVRNATTTNIYQSWSTTLITPQQIQQKKNSTTHRYFYPRSKKKVFLLVINCADNNMYDRYRVSSWYCTLYQFPPF